MALSSAQDPDSRQASPKAENFSLPSLSLPKGGGAIRGIGEKLNFNPATGTASFSLPVYFSPGRSGFSPSLFLSYDSGAGNSPFGLGWNLSGASISRKTEKKLPQYRDQASSEEDVFILSGAEDLVPALIQTAEGWKADEIQRSVTGEGTYHIKRYKPRVEGLFARVERWHQVQTGEIHWRVISKENGTSIYGKSLGARISDPENPERVFRWLLEKTYDDKGNIALYEYKAENREGIDPARLEEKTRLETGPGFPNRYLKRIRCANRVPYQEGGWLFEAVLDYGDHHPENPKLSEDRPWLCRQDPFSTYKSGFEIRTYRLCQRILMFHNFAELGPEPCLVRSTDFQYEESSLFSFLKSATQTGYVKKSGTQGYFKKSFPAVEFSYAQAAVDPEIHFSDSGSLENLPQGVDGQNFRWEDFDKEGIPGILSEHSGGWFYKRNLGAGQLAPLECVAEKPKGSGGSAGETLTDLEGDGESYLVSRGEVSGYWHRDRDGKWETFQPFPQSGGEKIENKQKVFLDLDGDGRAEILLDEDDLYAWYPSLGKKGYGEKEWVSKPQDEERRPTLVQTDTGELIFTADMSGDGLQDIVRIRNGEISYWPSLGWGRFGKKIVMGNSPCFDHPDQFDAARLRLADIDGSGVTDILYLGRHEIRYWLNHSGNCWSAPEVIKNFPETDNLAEVSAVDFLGNGTSCLVWSSPLSRDIHRPFRYLDLTGGKKPYLLETVKNNLGAETRLHYASSTKFYLEDRIQGRPWVSKLAFPVQVIERIETLDKISRNRFVSRFAYHHGYFDAAEREFRGFGMVEQWDTEDFSVLAPDGELPADTNVEMFSHVPPGLTKTWFYTGAGGMLSRPLPGVSDFSSPSEVLLQDKLPLELGIEEEREAFRAMRGSLIRQEIYAVDGTAEAGRPYQVSESSFEVRCLQPKQQNKHAVFITHSREAFSFQYDRKLYDVNGSLQADPRISHSFTLEVDDFGNVTRSAEVVYGRRLEDPDPLLTSQDKLEQKRSHVSYSENRFTNALQSEAVYRTPLPCQAKSYEIFNAVPAGPFFSFEELRTKILAASDGAHEIPCEDFQGKTAAPNSPSRRLIKHTRILYLKDDFSGPLALGIQESLGIPFQSWQMVLTPGMLSSIYAGRVTEAMLLQEGRYVRLPGEPGFWSPSGRIFFSPLASDNAASELAFAREHFFLPQRFADLFGNISKVRYDSYDLLPLESEDALQNKITVGERISPGNILNRCDYRLLQPSLITDPNGNRSQVSFDVLGFVTGTAVMGKTGETKGDSLAGFEPDLEEAELQSHIQNPFSNPQAILKKAATRLVYDFFAYERTKDQPEPSPCVVYSLARETHDADLAPGQVPKIQHTFSYSDGFAREIQKKVQAEPGGTFNPRWVGTGWTIFNNKGKAVRKYEPFFSATHRFEFFRQQGVSSTFFYDPLGRQAAALAPDHTWAKGVTDPWRQQAWDVNDTVLITDPKTDPDAGSFFKRLPEADYLPSWHQARVGGALGAGEQSSAVKTSLHAATPTTVFLDSLGRTFLSIADNGAAGKHRTQSVFDFEGRVRAVMDAKGRNIQQSDYDMAGNLIREISMEGPVRWILPDAAAKNLRNWDDRGRASRMVFDELQRPVETWMRDGAENEKLVQKIVYGENKGEALNHRGKVSESFDGAGKITNLTYDFKGNLLSSSRQFAVDYKNTLDWSVPPALESESFTNQNSFDALNRPVAMTLPDATVISPIYNDAGQLKSLTAKLRGAAEATAFVDEIDYDAKGQRASIHYPSGVETFYEYDPLHFRLRRSVTRRGNDKLQDFIYTYDPAGNITSIRDEAKQTVYFNSAAAEPGMDYTYDALYRLTEARGREHIGQAQAPQTSWNDGFRRNLPHPHDGQAMRLYREQYQYDETGNILNLIHQAQNGNWNRLYSYQESSLLQPAVKNNRLSGTQTGEASETFLYDGHGNMTQMPHLPLMEWNYREELKVTSRQAASAGITPEKTYYVYDAGGKRVRKITESQAPAGQAPARKCERLYIDGFEIYREYEAGGLIKKLERETLPIADGKKRIALIETQTVKDAAPVNAPSGLIRFQMDNHLGSASLELDEQGQIISYEEYYPFGSTSFQAGRSAAEVSLKRYAYTGKERDEENGFYYHGARYYASWLGRWISPDPIGIKDGVNVYAYVGNNPIKMTDPSGKEGKVITGENTIVIYDNKGKVKSTSVERSREYFLPEVTIEIPKETQPEMTHQYMQALLAMSLQRSYEEFSEEYNVMPIIETGPLEDPGGDFWTGFQKEMGNMAMENGNQNAEDLKFVLNLANQVDEGIADERLKAVEEQQEDMRSRMQPIVGPEEHAGALLALGTVSYAEAKQRMGATPYIPDEEMPAPGSSNPGTPWRPFTVQRSKDLSVNTGAPSTRWNNCSFNVCAVLTNRGKTSTQISIDSGLPETNAFPEKILQNLGVRSSPTYNPPDFLSLIKNLKTYQPGTNVGIYYTNPDGATAHSIMAMVGKNGDILFVDPQMTPMRVVQGPPAGASNIHYYVPNPEPR